MGVDKLKITLGLITDSYNSIAKDTIELLSRKEIETVYLKLGDREVGINKEELLGAVKLLCE